MKNTIFYCSVSVTKHLLLLFTILIISKVNATNYYFSSSRGDDSYNVKQVQSPATPWKTLNKLDSFFRYLKPGDSVLLKRGDTLRGFLTATANGVNKRPIVIGSYGVGALPVLTLPEVTGWQVNSKGIYHINKQMWPGISIFYQDGKPLLRMATTPDCTDGNWWCDNANLYYKPTSGKADDHKITIANIVPIGGYKPGIDLSNSSYITIDKLQIDAFGYGVKTFDTEHGTVGLTIQNSIFNYCRSAICIMPDKGDNVNATIQNCLFYRNQCAINMYTTAGEGGRPGQTHGANIDCNILNNEMAENGTIDGSTIWTYGTDREAIGLQNFSNGTISNNYIHGGNQIGIIIYNLPTRSSDNNFITSNFITENKRVAIGLDGEDADEGGAANYTFNNNVIAKNLIVNSGEGEDGAVIIYQGANTTKMNYFLNNTLVGYQNIIDIVTSRSPYFSIKNNIIYNPGKIRFIAYDFAAKPSNFEMDYNLYYESNGHSYGWQFSGPAKNQSQVNSLGMEMHSQVANPMFVNEDAGNFRLRPKSPAIDAGISIRLPFNGTAPDIGAFETDFQVSPLQFLQFNGTKTGKTNNLYWKTTNELTGASFEVLKSTDGVHFDAIGKLPINSKSYSSIYTFIDNNPHNGENYYQIKQVGKDGNYLLSEVISISHSALIDIHISPNPATNKLLISINSFQYKKSATLIIRNVTGSVVKTMPVNSSGGNIQINVSDLTNGTYFLSIINDNNTITEKFIKQ